MPDYRSTSMCMADRDGECDWDKCPQNRDGEPMKSGRHCPLDLITPETHSKAEAQRALQRVFPGAKIK